jgi:hypothetical protein
MNKPWMCKRLLLGGATVLAACTLSVAGLLWLTESTGAGLLWLGSGPRLQPQVEARLQPAANGTEYGSANSDDVASMYLEPLDPVKTWQILRVQTDNLFPLWESALDDDPVYSLTVDLDVEYANGVRARLRWSTWRYGLVLGPVVFSYGDGPPGRLMQLPDSEAP